MKPTIIIMRFHPCLTKYQEFIVGMEHCGGWFQHTTDTIAIYGKATSYEVGIIMNHEFLHRVLFQVIGLEACTKLDKLATDVSYQIDGRLSLE